MQGIPIAFRWRQDKGRGFETEVGGNFLLGNQPLPSHPIQLGSLYRWNSKSWVVNWTLGLMMEMGLRNFLLGFNTYNTTLEP